MAKLDKVWDVLKDERCIQDSHVHAFLSPDQKDGKVFRASSEIDLKLFVGWGK